MAIKFYQFNLSPPCRTVSMTMKGLKLEAEDVVTNPMTGAQKTPEYLAMNPRGKIPCLKDGDYVIYESRAIATYLCNQYEKGDDSTRLYPVDPKARGTVDQLLYVSENVFDMVIGYVNIRGIIFGNEKKPNEDKLPDVANALKLCEEYLTRNKFMAGDHFTLADIFMSSPLIMLSLPGYNDFKDYPKTQAWLAKIKALPYYDDVNKKALDTFIELYQDKIKSADK